MAIDGQAYMSYFSIKEPNNRIGYIMELIETPPVGGASPADLIAKERQLIDAIDGQIAGLLCKRYGCVIRVGDIKKKHSLNVFDSTREAGQMAALMKIAREHGVPASVVIFPFRMIIKISRACQGEKKGGRIVSRHCQLCSWKTAGIDDPSGSDIRVCPVCRMPLL